MSSHPRQPALDGVRALAVALVVLFHAGFGFMPGGYVGVSVFFTLSGFLITRLLLHEHAASGTISFGGFYARRLRRLVPASLLCVAAVVVARLFGAYSRVDGLRVDVVGAVLQVFNWVRLAGTTSYADLFAGSVSPLEHFWSLAIEEQFYWVWPVVFVVIVRWCARSQRSVASAVAGLTVLGALAAPLIAWRWGADAAYWSTPARIAEILVGALLATVMARGHRVPAWARFATAPAVAVIAAMAVVLPSGHGFAYSGGLPLVAVVSGVLLWSLQVPSRSERMLSWRPVVGLGRISYGVYLIHWPVDVLLRERGWRLDTLGGFAVATALTLVLALASYRLLERPIHGAAWSPSVTFRRAGLATAGVALLAVVVPAAVPAVVANEVVLDAAEIERAEGSLAPLVTPTAASTAASTATSTVPPTSLAGPTTTAAPAPTTTTSSAPLQPLRPVRMLVVGDSTALYVGQGLAAWSLDHPDLAQVSVRWCQGCTFMLEPAITTFADLSGVLDASRALVDNELFGTIDELRPDVVVLMSTVSDVANREWSADEGPLGPRDQRYRTRMRDAYGELTLRLLGAGVPEVVWVVPPVPTAEWREEEMNDLERYRLHHDVIREVVAAFDMQVEVADLDRWLDEAGHAATPSWRPDGVHFTEWSARQVAERWLGPLLVGVALGE
jgi:peptidoglycan/LPS O-acetylase OafA/YrhL